jgi:DNA-binding transcriptional LysR family regulator
MELRHLHYFIAVAEELHFRRAADRLNISQPPLSQQIQQLEKELGFPLFYRTKRSVTLTAAGQTFLVGVRQTIAQLDQTIQASQRASRGEQGHLILGFISSSTYNILPSLLQGFRQSSPHIELTLRELSTAAQIQQLQQGQIDLGLLRPPLDPATGLQSQTLWEESLIVALPSQHLLVQRGDKVVHLSDLAGDFFIGFPRQAAPRLYDQILGLCQQADFSPHIVQEALQMQTIVSLVVAGIGIAIVPASVQNLQRFGVTYLPIAGETPRATVAIAWNPKTLSAVGKKVLGFLGDPPKLNQL